MLVLQICGFPLEGADFPGRGHLLLAKEANRLRKSIRIIVKTTRRNQVMDLMLQRLVRFGKKRKVNLPLALLCVLFLYAVSAIGDCVERLAKALRGKPARRLAAAALSLCLVFHFAPVTALADVPDASTTPGIQGGVLHNDVRRCTGHIRKQDMRACPR